MIIIFILLCCWYIFICFVGLGCDDFLMARLPVSSLELLFGATLLPLVLTCLGTMVSPFIHDIKVLVIMQKNSGDQKLDVLQKHNDLNLFVRLICNKMDDEGRAYLSDAKLEWGKSKLTQNQIDRKGLRFAMSHYSGRFVTWLQLPRFLPRIKTRY
jgi:hypothetical protein